MKTKIHCIVLSMLMAGSAFPACAQTTGATQSNNALPQGYNTLILDWEDVSKQMSAEQKSGKGAHWPGWLRAGLAEGNSLYWWLLAQWHYNEGNQDLAYRTMLTAWTLTRMEASTCLRPDHPILKDLLHKHEQILRAGTTSNKAKQEAVLYSLNIAEAMTQKEPLRGMVCNIELARQAMERQKMARQRWETQAREAAQSGKTPPLWDPGPALALTDHRIVPGESQKAAILAQQRHALKIVGEEFKANQAREAADVNTIMRAMQK